MVKDVGLEDGVVNVDDFTHSPRHILQRVLHATPIQRAVGSM
jgi:hypothetical protein